MKLALNSIWHFFLVALLLHTGCTTSPNMTLWGAEPGDQEAADDEGIRAELDTNLSPQECLFLYAQAGNLKAIEALSVDKESTFFNTTNSEDQTALHLASLGGHTDVAAFLLPYMFGAYINKPDNSLNTALHYASGGGYNEIVQAILDCDGEHREIFADMKNHSQRTPLHEAAEKGHLDVVQSLLRSKNINIKGKDIRGDTPIVLSTQKGHVDIVRELLDFKPKRFFKWSIKINQKYNQGKTLLHIAAENNKEELVTFLLTRKGIKPKQQDKGGKTAHELATEKGYTNIADLLPN